MKKDSERYRQVIKNIFQLKQLDSSPCYVVFDDIDGGGRTSGGADGGTGDGIENIVQPMVTNSVVWHKSCRSAADSQKVARPRKSHEGSLSPIKTLRLRSEATSTTNSSAIATTFSEEPQDVVCIFCGEVDTDKELRKAATLGLDKKVNVYANILGDKNLLAKLQLMQCTIAAV